MTFKFLSKEEFFELYKVFRPQVFIESSEVDLNSFYLVSEQELTKQLDEMCTTNYRLYLTAWNGDELAAWSWGYQKSGSEFYMCNSGVLPKYQRQHIYTMLLERIIHKAQMDGFREITSKHHADNNAVIIPKLKAGFVVQGFEINPRFGLMLNLVKYTKEAVLRIHNERTGFKAKRP